VSNTIRRSTGTDDPVHYDPVDAEIVAAEAEYLVTPDPQWHQILRKADLPKHRTVRIQNECRVGARPDIWQRV
jgi:hypothetical protein